MPVVALLTDFGLADHYVGAMKGAVLGACPDATLVDLTHEVPAHDVEAGALALDASYRHFPGGTVFLAVVDPGVGSLRRPVAVGAGRWLFVGPDNGLFTFVLEAHPRARVHLLANPAFYPLPVSPVFHGRDLFAPAAGHLARGMPLEQAGPPVDDPARLELPPKTRTPEGLAGVVVHVDRFGNLVTTIRAAQLFPSFELEVAGRVIARHVRTFADAPPAEPFCHVDSSGFIAIAVNMGSAAATLGVGRRTPVVVRAR